MLDEIQRAVLPIFLSVMKASADHGGKFRLLITAKVNGESKPLLIFGSAHSQVEDGHLIAVLNPSKDLVVDASGLAMRPIRSAAYRITRAVLSMRQELK